MRKIFGVMVAILCGAALLVPAQSAELEIKDYVFTWTVYKGPDLVMEIEKTPDGVMVVLSGPGGRLGRISATPETAKAIGEVLKTSQKYYDEQTSKQEMNARDVVEVEEFKISFASSRGKNFGISVATEKIFSAAVNMNLEGALAIAPYLCQSPEMAALVEGKINP